MKPTRASAIRPLTKGKRRHLIFNIYTSGGIFILSLMNSFAGSKEMKSDMDGIILARIFTVVFGLAIFLTLLILIVNAWRACKLDRTSFAQRKELLKPIQPREQKETKQPRLIFLILIGALATIFWIVGIAELLGYRF